MRFRQIKNEEVLSILTDPNLWVLFAESDCKIDRKRVCKILPTIVAWYVSDTRYMFGYFESEETDGR